MKKPSLLLALLGFVVMIVYSSAQGSSQRHPLIGQRAPEFTSSAAVDWINSSPLSWDDLRGKVVLIDFWTFGCWNCFRSFPWLNGLAERFKDQGLVVLGVHSPEFDHEKERQALTAKIREFELKHPVMIDNDFRFWKAMHNSAWPSFYLIDRQGVVRALYVGETHAGDARAQAIEKDIQGLLAERGN